MGQSVKRSASHEKAADFHSSASRGLGRNSARNLDDVQELEGITATDDDENRLYHEQYGSEHSQEDGDRYILFCRILLVVRLPSLGMAFL